MKKKWFSLIVCTLLCAISYASVSAHQSNQLNGADAVETSEQLSLVVLTTDDASQVASALIRQGFDVLEKTLTDRSFELIVSPRELHDLQSRGFAVEVLSRGRPFRDIQQEQNQGVPCLIPPGYLDYPAIIDALYTAQTNYPSICKVYDLTAFYNLSATYEGRHIYAVKISDNVAQNEDEPNFLMVGAHHAREIVTPVLALYAIDQLTSTYGINATVTAAVNNYEIWIAPVWNPDGYAYMFNYDNYWRKNRVPYPPGIGVDLNRNYPFGWYSSGSGSTSPTSDTYKGPSPASEMETQSMIVWGNDRHFAKVLDYHSYGREVLYGYLSLTHPFTSFLKSEAQRLSIAVGYGGANRLASADGENYQWHLALNGSYSNLIETHTSFQPTYASALAEAVLVWPGTLWMLQRPISLSGHVRDSSSNEPLVISIKLEGITFVNGEHFMSEPRFGRYHFFLPPGTYTVNFSADGYRPQQHQITVSLSSADVLDVSLRRINEPPCTPTITGETNGFVGGTYEYVFSSHDPDNDTIEYFVDWGDGTNTSWIGPFENGQVANLSHQWYKVGTYHVTVKAKDVLSEESNWSAPLVVQIVSLMRSYVLGFIEEKTQMGECITFKAKYVLVFSSTATLCRSGEQIIVSSAYRVGFVGNRVVAGVFKAAVLSKS